MSISTVLSVNLSQLVHGRSLGADLHFPWYVFIYNLLNGCDVTAQCIVTLSAAGDHVSTKFL